jgi:hypothetical protein
MVVTGESGQARTDFCKQLLVSIAQRGNPFLLLTSSRLEYRDLIHKDPLKETLRVYTVGDFDVAPLAVNPFEVVDKIKVTTHIARLKEVFRHIYVLNDATAFGLEKTIEAAYERRGWNLLSGKNRRLGPDQPSGYYPELFPTLADLLEVLNIGVDGCGFDAQIIQDIKTTIKAIVGPLVAGTNRLVFNNSPASPIHSLFKEFCVLETGSLRSTQERSFLAALLLCFLEEVETVQSEAAKDEGPCHFFMLDDCAALSRLFYDSIQSLQNNRSPWMSRSLAELTSKRKSVCFVGLGGAQFIATGIEQPGFALSFRQRDPFELGKLATFLHLDLVALNAVKTLGDQEFVSLSPTDGSALKLIAHRLAKQNGPNQFEEAISEQVISTRQGGACAPHRYLGLDYFEGAFQSEYYALAERIVQDREFYKVFNRYIASFVEDLTQLVHFRTVLVHEVQRILGRKPNVPLTYTTWCTLCLASEQYFGAKALMYGWSLEQERLIKERWYGLLAPAFVPEQENNSLTRRLNISQLRVFRDQFIELHKVDQGPQHACGACTSKCLYGYDVQHFLNDPGILFDFNSSVSRKTVPPSETAAWFVRLFSERLIGTFNVDLAYCLAVHLIKEQQLSIEAQLVLLNKVRSHLLPVGTKEKAAEEKKGDAPSIVIQFPKKG